LPRSRAVLVSSVKGVGDRPVFLPCRLRAATGIFEAEPLPWTGSSDLVGLAAGAAIPGAVPGFIALPAEGVRYEPGTEVEVVLRSELGAS